MYVRTREMNPAPFTGQPATLLGFSDASTVVRRRSNCVCRRDGGAWEGREGGRGGAGGAGCYFNARAEMRGGQQSSRRRRGGRGKDRRRTTTTATTEEERDETRKDASGGWLDARAHRGRSGLVACTTTMMMMMLLLLLLLMMMMMLLMMMTMMMLLLLMMRNQRKQTITCWRNSGRSFFCWSSMFCSTPSSAAGTMSVWHSRCRKKLRSMSHTRLRCIVRLS
jgi:hypothetical protein